MGVRLRVAGGFIRPRFQPEPSEGDEVVTEHGLRVFVSREIVDGLDGDLVIDVTAEHEQLTVRGR
jgi:Fe-S cluster assembly iron-binding protein IscA